MSNIIAIQGYKNSGKDTCAEILKYLLNVPKILHSFFWFNSLRELNIKGKFKIVHYADKIKAMLSVLLCVDKELFDDRDFKEFFYVDFSTLSIVDSRTHNIPRSLTDSEFNKKLKNSDLEIAKNYWLSVRQLLQLFGTEIMRNFFGDKLWILTTLNNVNVIVADQRFKVENIEVSNISNSLILHIIRPNCKKGFHTSETELEELESEIKYDILINNDGTVKELFNKLKELVHNGSIY